VLDALRRDHRQFRFQTVTKELQDETFLESTTSKDLKVKTSRRNTLTKRRHLDTIKFCIQKQQAEYFYWWKSYTLDYRKQLMINLTQKIIGTYRAYLKGSFDSWKRFKAIKNKRKIIHMQEEIYQNNVKLTIEIKEAKEKL
jgi:hypothetical protein